MLLLATGCSMTFGQELPDEDREANAWAGIVAKHFGMHHENIASCGASNDRSVRVVIEYVAKYIAEGRDPRELFVIVGWTSGHRKEIAISRFEGLPGDGFYSTLFANYKNEHPVEVRRLYDLYVRDLYSERECRTRFVNQVVCLQSFLKIHSIQYLFVKSLPCCDPPWDEVAHQVALIDQRCFMGFHQDFNTFIACAQASGKPFGPKGHPLHEGHRIWSDEIIAYIKSSTYQDV